MNTLKIFGIGIIVSVILCVIIFDVIGVATMPMNCLFIFLGIIHLCAFVQIFLLIIVDEKMISQLKLSFGDILPAMIKSAIVSLIIAGVIYLVFDPRIRILFDFFIVGISYGLVSSLTTKSRNSTIWCAIVLSLTITAFIFHSLFLLNFELLALLGIIVGGFSLSCHQCGTWWSFKLVNTEFVRQFQETRYRTITKRGTMTGTGQDYGRRFDFELPEIVPYYKTRKVYRKDYCCEVCGEGKSEEEIK